METQGRGCVCSPNELISLSDCGEGANSDGCITVWTQVYFLFCYDSHCLYFKNLSLALAQARLLKREWMWIDEKSTLDALVSYCCLVKSPCLCYATARTSVLARTSENNVAVEKFLFEVKRKAVHLSTQTASVPDTLRKGLSLRGGNS